MAIPQPKVEIGFDLTGDPTAPFVTLNDPVKGILGSTEYVLGGTLYYDVTEKMVEISTSRGKNRQLDIYDVGLASVTLQNNDRTFDPTFEASPYYPQIIPKRPIRITSGDERVFVGVADDWNLFYDPNGTSLVSLSATDAFAFFSEQLVPAGAVTQQKSGERLNELLTSNEVRWPINSRQIDTGIQTLSDAPIPDNQTALSYFQQISKSEPGPFFISRDGDVVFKSRYAGADNDIPSLADDGTGIPYVGMRISYGSELLYNQIVLVSSAGTAVASDASSINEYGVLTLSQTDLLQADLDSTQKLAELYSSKYSQPEYRFESVDIQLDELTPEQQAQILALEMGDYVSIKFTPNGIPPAITRNAEVIRIQHAITQTSQVVSLGFATVEGGFWRLSDPIFGKLSAGNSLAY